MTLKENIVATVETLSTAEQQEILDFAQFLKSKSQTNGKKKVKSLEGLWKNVDISAEDIDEARREMWGNFPREESL